MPSQLRAGIIILLGPGADELSRFRDLLRSFQRADPELLGSSAVVVVNDSRDELDTLRCPEIAYAPTVRLLDNPYRFTNYQGPVYDRLSAGMIVALGAMCRIEGLGFVVKIDTDALVLRRFGREIGAYFSERPQVGLIGSVATSPDGKARGTEAWWGRAIVRTCGTLPSEVIRFHLKHRIPFKPLHAVTRWRQRRRLLRAALGRGWRLGTNVLGGAYALSPAALTWIAHQPWLWCDPFVFEGTRIPEDVAVSMMVAAAGLDLRDYNGTEEVFGVWYQRPSMSVRQLIDGRYAIVHSIKAATPELEAEMRLEIATAAALPLLGTTERT